MKKTEEALEKCANKVDKLGKIVEHMHIGWTTERRKRLKVEADILANVVFINGIEFHENATKDKRYETPVETMQKTHEFLAAIKHETFCSNFFERLEDHFEMIKENNYDFEDRNQVGLVKVRVDITVKNAVLISLVSIWMRVF